MKKRVLSVVLSALMILSSVSVAFAASDYDGIMPLKTEEKVLDQLNADAEAEIFDKAQHQYQLEKLTEVNVAFGTNAAVEGAWDEYIDVVYTKRKTDFIESYLQWLQLAYEEDVDMTYTAKSALEGMDGRYDTTDRSLAESIEKLDGYQDAAAAKIDFFKEHNYFSPLQDSTVEKYVRMASEPVFKMILSTIGSDEDATSVAKSYGVWMENDRAKKLLAILYGEALTRELAADSTDAGVVGKLKEYMRTSDGLGYINNQLNAVFESSSENFVSAVYKCIGNVLNKAYEGDELQADIKMLFGAGEDKGAFECGMNVVDPDGAAANVLLNLFLSEYVQTQIGGEDLTTITASTPDTKTEIEDNQKVKFVPENIFEEYGITEENVQSNLSYKTTWFDIECYKEGASEPTSYVDFSNGTIQITKDPEEEGTYNAYLVLYRKSANNTNDTFIESYPVTVVNAEKKAPSGGGGTTKYLLTLKSEDGTVIETVRYSRGETVELTMVPVKDGYVFGGWYLDKELTKRVDAVVMSNSVTVYAAWNEIQGVDVPEMLNGEEHFAYVIGYPDGTVRPQNNITRAEAATILFRLLKDSVREENMTTENIFVDSNEGDWYNTAVSTLAALKIVNGRTETEFAPNEYITRAEFATIFARFAQFEADAGAMEFTDINNHWAKEYIIEAASYGWIKGYEDNSFRPDQRITRAEAMTLINRVLKRIPENAEDLHADMVKWSDNSETAWYYIAVQEATNSHKYEMKNNVNEKWTEITENRDWTTFEK